MNLMVPFECFYLIAGANIAPLLISLLFARDRAWGALGEVVPGFVVVIGTVLLWPMLIFLALEIDQ